MQWGTQRLLPPDDRDVEALIAFHNALGAIEAVAKSESADTGRYTIRYASLNAVLEECRRACQLHDLAISQEPCSLGDLFAVRTTLIHKNGGVVRFEPMCLPMPKDAQAIGSATTYLRRYSLVSLFGIPVEDDDGMEATRSVRAPAQHQGSRTAAEREIREIIGLMPNDERTAFMADFREEFGMGLSDLPGSRHGDALTYTKFWKQVEPHDHGDSDEQ